MDLYSITFMFRNSPNVVRLMFKNQDAAIAVWARVLNPSAPRIQLEDDYGKSALILFGECAAATFAHTNNELNAAQDEQILQAHAQIQLNKKVKADPILQSTTQQQTILDPSRFMNGAAAIRQ